MLFYTFIILHVYFQATQAPTTICLKHQETCATATKKQKAKMQQKPSTNYGEDNHSHHKPTPLFLIIAFEKGFLVVKTIGMMLSNLLLRIIILVSHMA